jgi:hypothetical protein
MDAIHKFSAQVIEVAERLSDVADAVDGKGPRTSRRGMSWVLLPAAGAALYALVRSDFFAREAKGVANEAKTRAADLPNDLMNAVRQTSHKNASRNGARTRSQSSPSSRTSSSKRTTRSSRGSSTRSRSSKSSH